jgi:hypothetical protein
MTLGLSIGTFTQLHVLISLIGILSGAAVLYGLLKDRYTRFWVATFLITTIATSVTGFMFPSKFDVADVVGLISLAALAVAWAAFYGYKLQGPWRWLFVTTVTAAFYLNSFVAVVQSFQKIAFLHALAPTQAEPPFAIAQGTVLLVFVALGILALKRFHAPRKAP